MKILKHIIKLLIPYSKSYCEICQEKVPKHQIVFMSGSDYQYWAANQVCQKCIKGN